MAELVTGPDGATVDGVLHLGTDGLVAFDGYQVRTSRTALGIRYEVRTPDGDELSWTAPAALSQRTLILGGARSGKSTEAERLLAHHPDTLYVATGYAATTNPQTGAHSPPLRESPWSPPLPGTGESAGTGESPGVAGDAEWAERIAHHRARRPPTWGCAETIDLVPLLRSDGPPLLIDCLTLWLSQTMDACEVWDHPTRTAEVEQRIDDLAVAWSSTRRLVVAVSNEVGSGIVPATASGRLFRDLMGRTNTTIAQRSDTVLWCVAGRAIPL